MGSDAMSDFPQLPAGFQLEASGPPPLPEGFVPEQPRSAGIGGLGDETARAFNENLNTFKAAGPDAVDPRNYNSLQQTLNVGKAIAAVPGMAASWITGPARSIIGRGFDAASPLTQEQRDQYGLESGRDVADKAMMGLAPRGASPIGIRTRPPAAPTGADLTKAAVDTYNDPAIKAIQVPPSDVAQLAGKIENNLLQQGFRPTTGSAPGTLAEIDRLHPGNVPSVSVDDLRAARRALSMTAKQIDPATFRATPDAAAASKAMEELDSFLDNISPTLKDANANYRAGKSGERLDYRVIKADRRAAKSGSGMNIENTIRQEVDKIPDRGLTPEQRQMRDQIVLGTPVRNALRTTGKLGVDGGLSLMLHGGAALGTGGTTLPITVSGTLARKLGEILTRRSIGKLSENIRNNSPLARSLAPSALPGPNPFLSAGAAPLGLSQLLGIPFKPMLPSYADTKQ